MENMEETGAVGADGTDPPSQQSRIRFRIFAIVLPAVVVVALVFGAGIFFGRSDGTGSTASGQPAKSSVSVDPRFTASMRLVQCIRGHGVPNFPDPQPNGEVLLNNNSGVDINGKVYLAAEAACKQYLPTGMSGGGPPDEKGVPSTERPSQQQQRAPDLTKYVACMRDKGVKQFPNPDALGNFRNVDPNWPGLQAAQAACAKDLPPGAPGVPK